MSAFTEETRDKVYPHALAVLAAAGYAVVCWYYPKYALPKNMKDLLTASATISSIVVGFLATAKATLLSISHSKSVKWMKQGNQYQTLIDYFMTAVHYSIFTAVLSALMLLFDFSNLPQYARYFVGLWIFLSVGSLSSGYRIILLYASILRNA